MIFIVVRKRISAILKKKNIFVFLTLFFQIQRLKFEFPTLIFEFKE